MIITVYSNWIIPPETHYRKNLKWVMNEDAVPKKNDRDWIYDDGFHKYRVRIRERKTIRPPKKWGGALAEWDNAKGVFVPFYKEREENGTMMAIDPPNLEPPYDPVYDDLEVWRVTISWDGDEWETRYIPYIGYDSHEMLDSFKREFHKEVMRYVGYASPSREQEFVYSVLTNNEALEDCWDEEYMDTFALLYDISSYPCEEPYKTRYYKKDIIDWLKNNTERWCKIEVMNFWDIPEEKQKEIRSFIEEERAIEDHINRGGEL